MAGCGGKFSVALWLVSALCAIPDCRRSHDKRERTAALATPAPPASADGEACTLGGIEFPLGSAVDDLDACNSCTCVGGVLGMLCTQTICRGSASPCFVNDVAYANGSTNVPDPTSCNCCSCINGEITHCSTERCGLPGSCNFGVKHYQNAHGFVTKDGGFVCTCNAGTFECGRDRGGASEVPPIPSAPCKTR